MSTLDLKQNEKQFILNGNLWNVMFHLSWPAVIAMVLYGFNTLIDAFFVNIYISELAFAGVSLAYPITQISTGLGALVGVGAGSLLSIAIGAKDVHAQEKLLGNVTALSIICTIIYMLLALLFSESFITAMGGANETLNLGEEYFTITVYGTIFWILGLAFNMIIRSEGKMKTAAWMMAIGLLANIIFTYIFIVYLNMGVAGAAWGTNIGMLIYTITGFLYFFKGHATFSVKMFSLRIDKEIMGTIMRLGMPSLIMVIMTLVQAITVFNVLSIYGTIIDIAFYGVVYRIYLFLLTPIFGLMRALQPIVGINYGAGQYERTIQAYKVFGLTAMILTFPFFLASLIIPHDMLGMMWTKHLITATQITCFKVYMAALPILCFVLMAMSFFPSINKAKPTFIIAISRQLVLFIPIMLVVPMYFGVQSIYYATFGVDFVVGLWVVVLLKKEFKNLRKMQTAE